MHVIGKWSEMEDENAENNRGVNVRVNMHVNGKINDHIVLQCLNIRSSKIYMIEIRPNIRWVNIVKAHRKKNRKTE